MLKSDANGMKASETYDVVSSVSTGVSLNVWLGSSDPSVGASGIDQECVYSSLARVPRSATDPHTICWWAANPDSGGVDN